MAAGRAGEARDAVVGKVQSARVVADGAAATSPVRVQQATVFAQAAGIKNRTWQGNAVLTAPAPNVGHG